jgi:hypothetical protein
MPDAALRGCPRMKENAPCLSCLELPVLVHRLDGPVELFPQCLGEELLDRDVELLGEDDGETRVDVVLKVISIHCCATDVG